jgi:aspartyl-tRNA(Asn)/glutamyl-tRNA(Gln) amidotransferase subunit A
MDKSICFMSARELTGMIRLRKLSPLEAVQAVLDRIESENRGLNAYVTVIGDEALAAAREAEQALVAGRQLGPLHGVPIAIKDLELKAGVRNTFGSVPFSSFVPATSGTNVERLEAAGAITVGKTNVPEFGHKGTTDNFVIGPTSTPFAAGKNAGGSSGGSAAAVAAGMAIVAHGSDGGGSIRIPASLCGVYGLKPSYGRVPRVARPNGFISHTPFGQAGPLTRTVEDAALMLEVMAGEHTRDPLCLPSTGTRYLDATLQTVKGLKIAYSPNLDVFPVEPAVLAAVGEAVRVFESLGAAVEQVRIGIERSQAELSAVWVREVAVQLADMAGALMREGTDLLGDHRGDLAPEVANMLELAQDMRTLDYKLDDIVRTEVFDSIQDVFDDYDLLITPTLAVASVPNGADGNTLGPHEVCGEAVDPLLGWCLTYVFNFTGHPAASIPAGFTDERLPVGMQIAGRRFADATVLTASAAFERAKPWADTYPQ